MVLAQSSTLGVYNPTITTTGPGSPAQQAFAKQQADATAQANRNQLSGGAIALAPMQPGTSPSQIALNQQVQSRGAQTAANGQFDCTVNNTCPTTGGRRRRTRKTRTNKRKTRRNHKKSKRRRTRGSRK